MKRLKKFALTLFIASIILTLTPQNIYAANSCLGEDRVDFIGSPPIEHSFNAGAYQSASFRLDGLEENSSFVLRISNNNGHLFHSVNFRSDNDGRSTQINLNDSSQPYAFKWYSGGLATDVGWAARNWWIEGPNLIGGNCVLWDYSINGDVGNCYVDLAKRCYETDEAFDITISDATKDGNEYGGNFLANVGRPGSFTDYSGTISNGGATINASPVTSTGDLQVKVNFGGGIACEASIAEVKNACTPEDQDPSEQGPSSEGIFRICNTTTNLADRTECIRCSDKGVWTALGCLQTDPNVFIPQLLTIAISIAGGIALLLMIFGAFRIAISAGDPKGVEEGRGMITNAVIGLVVIIFSVILLNLIGVSILEIPGL